MARKRVFMAGILADPKLRMQLIAMATQGLISRIDRTPHTVVGRPMTLECYYQQCPFHNDHGITDPDQADGPFCDEPVCRASADDLAEWQDERGAFLSGLKQSNDALKLAERESQIESIVGAMAGWNYDDLLHWAQGERREDLARLKNEDIAIIHRHEVLGDD